MKVSAKIGAVVCAAVLSAALAGCSGNSGEDGAADGISDQPTEAAQGGAAPDAAAPSNDFDGSAFSDAGEGAMTLYTAGGTSEGGNVPQVAGAGSTMNIEIDTDGMDGSVCTVYVDGVENTTLNAGERTQNTIVIEGHATEPGIHTVELVKMDGDVPAIYKSAQYEIV